MFKVDTHVHTKEVSHCGRIDAKTIVNAYKDLGYGGIVITDHFNFYTFKRLEGESWDEKVEKYLLGYRAAKTEGEKVGLKVYLGMEIKTMENDNEFLLYGFDESFLFENENLFLKPIAEIKKIADEKGLVLIQAHPFRIMCHAVPSEIVHGVEVFNGHFGHNSSNEMAKKLWEARGGIATSGSDCHDLCAAGNGGIIFPKEPENIADALKNGDYELVESEKQWTKILFLTEGRKKNIKKMCALKDCDCAVICSGGNFEVADKDGKILNETIPVISRIHIIKSTDDILDAPKTEPSILLCEKITPQIKKIAEKNFVQAVVSFYGDDNAPYEENEVLHISYDMSCENEMFSMDIMGENISLEKITL